MGLVRVGDRRQPDSFDCSELTKWAAARSGRDDSRRRRASVRVAQGTGRHDDGAAGAADAGRVARSTSRGEPQPGLGGEPPVAHVAISLGNGKTIEAKGHAYGVGVFEAGDRFNYAGMIPG